MNQLKLKNERISSIVTIAVQMFLVINTILTAAGKNPIPLDESTATEFITYIVTGVWSVWTWWRNNNMTRAAVAGQLLINHIKKEEQDDEEDELQSY